MKRRRNILQQFGEDEPQQLLLRDRSMIAAIFLFFFFCGLIPPAAAATHSSPMFRNHHPICSSFMKQQPQSKRQRQSTKATTTTTITSQLTPSSLSFSALLSQQPAQLAPSTATATAVVLLVGLRGGGGGNSSVKKTKNKKKQKTTESKTSKSAKATTKKKKKVSSDDDFDDEDATTETTEPPNTNVDDATESTDKDDKSKGKDVIDKFLKETSAEDALGDAIRQRAEEVLYYTYYQHAQNSDDPRLQALEQSLASVGSAMGASDARQQQKQRQERQSSPTAKANTYRNYDQHHLDHAGVQTDPGAVLVSYFLKSHGGAHAIQSVCSLLATLAGIGSIVLTTMIATSVSLSSLFSSTKTTSTTTKTTTTTPTYFSFEVLSLTLLQRACLFAMIKHISGVLAASCLAAQAIVIRGSGGIRTAQWYMHDLAHDEVSQYVFYSASVLFWVAAHVRHHAAAIAAATTTTTSPIGSIWWHRYPLATIVLVGPIVLREMVSTALVVSDCLVLWAFSTSSKSIKKNTQPSILTIWIQRIVSFMSTIVDAWMSLLVTPRSKWRSASILQRQAILATLISRICFWLEASVGVLMIVDAVWAVFSNLFLSAQQGRPSVLNVVQRVAVARLYGQFLWTTTLARKQRRKMEY